MIKVERDKNVFDEIQFSFRLISIENNCLDSLKEIFSSDDFEIIKKTKNGKFNVVLYIKESNLELFKNDMKAIIKEFKVSKKDYGVYISLISEYDNSGVSVPEYIIELVRLLGGSLDFSVIIVE